MASRFTLTGHSADFRLTNPASLIQLDSGDARRMAILFDGATEQAADWSFVAPEGITTPIEIELFYVMDTATSGNAQWGVSVEAVTPDADSLDLDAADSFDTENTGTDATVPGTAGNLASLTITLTNNDSIAAGDLVRLRLTYETASTASGDAIFIAADFRDAA